ncbi:tautomerase family protein [Streptomyces violaceorubidus]|uniref:tautomerase family protein n=1 Tax=Streptomyces violaceorubidus TaxID=284042 RepID=UPI0004C1171E|nr:tautomerase family protein [Streptomyces violaceorubidus]
MPHFEVRIHEEELDGKVERKLVLALTDALVRVYGEQARAMAVVELFGIPRHRWGIGGEPAAVNAPIVSLNLREAALHLPGTDDAPRQLIRSVTDAVAEVFGESVRRHVSVYIVGVPAGRSGVGGEVDPPPAA